MKLDTFAQEIEDMWSRVAVLQRETEAQKVQPQQLEIFAQVFEELSKTTEELYVAHEQLKELTILLEEQNQLLNTAYQEAEVQRQKAEAETQRYQQLFEFAPDAYLVTSIDGVITETNQGATALLNMSQSCLLGETLDTYIAEPDNITVNQLIADLGKIIGVKEFELRLRPRDRTPITCVCRVRQVSNSNNNDVTLHWLIRDICHHKQTQSCLEQTQQELHQVLLKEKSLDELKSRIISTTSHEFRTPLTTILSSAEMLENYRHKWSDSKQLTHIHRIQDAAKQMTHLLNDILTLSNIEVNKLNLSPISFDLVQFCRELIEELLVRDNYQHAIAFSTQSQFILGSFDLNLVQHILYNLLSNSLKYSPISSTIHFTLSSLQNKVQSLQNKVQFEISDCGIGIPRKDLPYIFEPFYRGSNVANIRGSGLGMTIVKEAVDLHSGNIDVRSSIEVGTTFTVTLPFHA